MINSDRVGGGMVSATTTNYCLLLTTKRAWRPCDVYDNDTTFIEYSSDIIAII